MAKPNKATTAPARTPVKSSPPSGESRSQGQTGETDENYNLVSVLYHALQGAETLSRYIRDAQQADDEELVSFFEETKEAYVERASEAKQLLAARLAEALEDEEDDEDDEDEDEEDEEED
jgi:hypothetical protein